MNKVKLYLNENLSWRVARSLRGYGYDVVSSHEINMNTESDESQFELAVSQGRAIVTNNFGDFSDLHNLCVNEDKNHYGIIFTTKCSLSTLIRRLRAFLEAVPRKKMINQIRWLNDFQ